jgi:hypothetical protein
MIETQEVLKQSKDTLTGLLFCFFPVPGCRYDVEEYLLEDILKW